MDDKRPLDGRQIQQGRERERERELPLLSVSCCRTLAMAAMADRMAIDTMATTRKPRVRILRRLAAIVLQCSQIIRCAL
jgi:hypothetical protein